MRGAGPPAWDGVTMFSFTKRVVAATVAVRTPAFVPSFQRPNTRRAGADSHSQPLREAFRSAAVLTRSLRGQPPITAGLPMITWVGSSDHRCPVMSEL